MRLITNAKEGIQERPYLYITSTILIIILLYLFIKVFFNIIMFLLLLFLIYIVSTNDKFIKNLNSVGDKIKLKNLKP